MNGIINLSDYEEISLKEAKEYQKLGKAVGSCLAHCFSLASKFCESFNQIKYYVIISDTKSMEIMQTAQIKNKSNLLLTDRKMIVEFYK